MEMLCYLTGAKLLTIKHEGVSLAVNSKYVFEIYLIKQLGFKKIISSFTNKQKIIKNTDLIRRLGNHQFYLNFKKKMICISINVYQVKKNINIF